MKHWQELGQLLERVVRLGREGRASALAIVTRIEGSAYRRPGAKLLIEDGGSALGGVSGGCLEEDVRQVGLEVLESGRSRLLHYDTSDDESKLWGLGLGCDGKIDVWVQAVPVAHALGVWSQVRELLRGDTAFAVSIPLVEGETAEPVLIESSTPLKPGESDRVSAAQAVLAARKPELLQSAGNEAFIDVLLPPPKLVVCGASEDARPLVSLAASVGFRVFVVDHRRALLGEERFPEAHAHLCLRPEQESPELPLDRQSSAVVKTHSLARDTDWVRRFLAGDTGYVGILGPRARTRKILDGVGPAERQRVFGPVGLDLGADGAEQVALSIVAELLAVLRERRPVHLRERESSVHGR